MHIKFEPIKSKCGEIVETLMSSTDIPDDESVRFKVRLAIEEVVENIVNYAYDRGDGWIEAIMSRENDKLKIVLIDAGTPFDPLDKPDPNINLSIDERQVGGLGIFLCKQLMDEVSYKYENGCNVLSLSKNI